MTSTYIMTVASSNMRKSVDDGIVSGVGFCCVRVPGSRILWTVEVRNGAPARNHQNVIFSKTNTLNMLL